MRLAALVMAHKNANQLVRLIRALKDDEIDVYVHLDKKWNISQKELEAIKKSSPYVTVLDQRISGFLDTWSLCEITIALLKKAYMVEQYDYFILLSGQDYLIKPVSYIKQYLKEQYPTPLIDCTPLRKDNWVYSGFKWIRFNCYYRKVEKITKNKKLRKILLLPIYAVQVIVTFVMKSPYKRLTKIGCDLYGGSAWWILPKQVVELCISEVDANTDIVKAFKLKNTPEESFFQTMTMRSTLKELVTVNNPYEILQNCMTYAYFFDDTHQATGHPFILTVDNFDMLKARKELFARKFDMTVNDEILDKIDQEILRR